MSTFRTLCAALLPTALLISGCGEGVLRERWPETGLRRMVGRVETADGEQRTTRLWTFWYPDGETKQAQGQYDGGSMPDLTVVASGGTRVPAEGRTKRWSFWDPGGVLLAEGLFAEGLRDDLWACWKEDGEFCCTGSFEAGRPSGFHVTWVDGVRRDEHYYVEGVLDGPRVVRDASGAELWRGEYGRGELISSEPQGASEPPLHLLERCARAAEEGRRTTPAEHLDRARGG